MRDQYRQANRKSIHRDAKGGYSPLLHTEHPHKSNADQHVIASGFADGWGERSEQIQDCECEAIQPIEKAEQEKQETGLIHVKNLFPYSLIPLKNMLVKFSTLPYFYPSYRSSFATICGSRRLAVSLLGHR